MVGGPNLYAYAGNNPVNVVDPSGRGGVHLRGVRVDAGGSMSARSGGGGGSSAANAGTSVLCMSLMSIAVINLVGGLVFGSWWSAYAAAVPRQALAIAAAGTGAHMAISVWIPELLFSLQAGALMTLAAVAVQIGAWIISIVAAMAGWWSGFIIASANIQLYGPSFVINSAGALIGFGLTMYSLVQRGCL